MTDKELAKEYVDKLYAEKVIKKDYDKDGRILYRSDDISDAFLAGRSKWHDLRKNRLDLPHRNCTVLIFTDWNGYELKRFSTQTRLFDELTFREVIAWCEIPQYTEE